MVQFKRALLRGRVTSSPQQILQANSYGEPLQSIDSREGRGRGTELLGEGRRQG